MPFRIEETQPAGDLEYFIGDTHWLDALTPPLEQHLDYLSGTVGQLLGRDEAPVGGASSSTPPRLPRALRTQPHRAIGDSPEQRSAASSGWE